MIVFEKRMDIFKCEMQTLVVPVNTAGVMGNGLARAFRDRVPDLNEAYQRACRNNIFKYKGFFVFDVRPGLKILCFPTKRRWQDDSKLEWIIEGLERIASDYKKYSITSIAIPAIGCGKGNLDWTDVHPLIRDILGPSELQVGIILPY